MIDATSGCISISNRRISAETETKYDESDQSEHHFLLTLCEIVLLMSCGWS